MPYRIDSESGWKRVGGVSYAGGGDLEAIAWDGADLLLMGENRGVYRVAERDWRGTGTGGR